LQGEVVILLSACHHPDLGERNANRSILAQLKGRFADLRQQSPRLGDDLASKLSYATSAVESGLEVHMTTQTQTYRPSPSMIFSAGLLLAGLSVPPLMLFELIPPTLLFGALGLALTAAGGVLLLTYCGEA
jgi:hypothetical protein